MPHPTRDTAAARGAAPGIFFHGLRHDLREGRQWEVVTNEGHVYRVVFHEHDGLRFGFCNCKAATFNHLCRHVRRAAPADALLFVAQYRRSEERRINAAMSHWYYGN